MLADACGCSSSLRWLCVFRRRFVAACSVPASVLAIGVADARAQVVPGGMLTLQAAAGRALAPKPTNAAARLRGPIDMAGLEVARERLNPEASIEFEKETPKQAYGISVPLELGGKRAKRIAIGEATIRAGEAEIAL